MQYAPQQEPATGTIRSLKRIVVPVSLAQNPEGRMAFLRPFSLIKIAARGKQKEFLSKLLENESAYGSLLPSRKEQTLENISDRSRLFLSSLAEQADELYKIRVSRAANAIYYSIVAAFAGTFMKPQPQEMILSAIKSVPQAFKSLIYVGLAALFVRRLGMLHWYRHSELIAVVPEFVEHALHDTMKLRDIIREELGITEKQPPDAYS